MLCRIPWCVQTGIGGVCECMCACVCVCVSVSVNMNVYAVASDKQITRLLPNLPANIKPSLGAQGRACISSL